MDELIKHIQNEVLLFILFAGNVVLVDEIKVKINNMLEVWRETVESKGFQISRNIIEYIECNFGNNRNAIVEFVKIEDQEILRSEHFGFFGSIMHWEDKIGDDVSYKI